VTEHDTRELPDRFEQARPHLRGVAYRMLGSFTEAEDAVQETWLRLSRSDVAAVDNLTGWLTTVVARVCLDMLRSRKSRREDSLDAQPSEPIARGTHGVDPEQEALLADSVGVALLVVLETLGPAERLAFVLHDMFGVSFDEIGRIVGRSPAAARQLASRARRQVRGGTAIGPTSTVAKQRDVVTAFLAALRAGDLEALLAVLDPDVVVRADAAVVGAGGPTEVRGAQTWAKGAVAFSRGAQFAHPALIDGSVGLIFAPRGRLFRAVRFTLEGDRIAQVEVIGDPERLRKLALGVLTE
jgi:RNA polymerase sigma factor (sigma-70 family)